MAIKVKIKGNKYWFTQNSFDEKGAIAPLEHCYKNGELNPFTCFKSESFAHYYPVEGVLKRGVKILSRKEFEKLVIK